LVYNEVPIFSVIAEKSLDASPFSSSSVSFLRAQRRPCHRPPSFPRHQRHLLLHFTPRVARLLSCSPDALYNQPQHHGTPPSPRVLSSLSTPSRRVPPTPRHDVVHLQRLLHFIPGRLASLRICSTSLRVNLSPLPTCQWRHPVPWLPPLRPPHRPGRPAAHTPRRSLQQDHVISRKLLDHLTEPLQPPACRNIAAMTKPDRRRPLLAVEHP
jgi:hypothetical protein